jgi:hypothetical protein
MMRSATVRMDDGTDGQMDGWMGWMESFMKNDHDVLYYM